MCISSFECDLVHHIDLAVQTVPNKNANAHLKYKIQTHTHKQKQKQKPSSPAEVLSTAIEDLSGEVDHLQNTFETVLEKWKKENPDVTNG